MPEPSFGQLTAGLRSWTRDHDPHVRAAVELLIWHEHWLRRPDFTRAAVGRSSDGTVCIDWTGAARFAGTAAQRGQRGPAGRQLHYPVRAQPPQEFAGRSASRSDSRGMA